LENTPGGGAAGGLGAGCIAFLNAEIVEGFKLITEIVNLRENVRWADVVVTGEGKVDTQTLNGKLVCGVVNLANELNKPVTIFCGKSEVDERLLGSNVRVIQNEKPGMGKEYSIAHAEELLRSSLREYFSL
jgi:glycerate kinase